MLVSFDKKFLFVHIPKTAGTSLSFALSPYRNRKPDSFYCKAKTRLYSNFILNKIPTLKPKHDEFNFYNHTHLTAIAAQQIIPENTFKSLFKFTIVRHPVDWHYSMYRHILSKHRDSQYRPLFEPVFKHPTFPDYMQWRIDTDFIAPQVSQLVDASGAIIVDEVYRFESLKAAFEDICKRLNLSLELPQMNKGVRTREKIDNRTKNLIFEKFRVDFSLFGYTQSSVEPNWKLEQKIRNKSDCVFEKLKTEEHDFSLWARTSDMNKRQGIIGTPM